MLEIETNTSMNSQIFYLPVIEEEIDGRTTQTLNLPDNTKVWIRIKSDFEPTDLYYICGNSISGGIDILEEDWFTINQLIFNQVLCNIQINGEQIKDFTIYDIDKPRGLNGVVSIPSTIVNKYKGLLNT